MLSDRLGWRMRLQVTGGLLMLLSACAMGAPRSGMGAVFATPEAAFGDALGPRGWLGGGLDQLMLHHKHQTPDGMIVLYSGYSEGGLVLGSADAKPRRGGWYAHGMFQVPVPESNGSQKVSCAVMRHQTSGTWATTMTGQIQHPDVRDVFVVFDSGPEELAAIRDGIFMLMRTETGAPRELRAVDKDGSVVARLPAQECAVD